MTFVIDDDLAGARIRERPEGMDRSTERRIDTTARIGLLVPSTNTVAETDFWTYKPSNASVHTGRMFIQDTTADGERRMIEDHLADAVRDVATVRPHVVVFSCTSAGAVLGLDAEASLVEEISRACSAPVVSTNEAVAVALKKREIRRVGVITAYVDELTERIVETLSQRDLEPVVAAGLNILDPFDICGVTPDRIVQFAREKINPDDVDGIFVSCTNLRAYEARQALEEWSGLPVVTSNQAALEAAIAYL